MKTTKKRPALKRRGRPPASENSDMQPLADQLRRAAILAFSTQGFDRASFRSIAREVGVDASLIAHKFGSKLGLWQSAIDDLSRNLLEALAGIPKLVAGSNGSGERLAKTMAGIIDMICDTPYLAPFLLHEVARQDERFDYFYSRLIKPVRDVLHPLIVDACRSGALGEVDPDFYFVAFAGSFLNLIAARPFLTRLSRSAKSDKAFRDQVKKAVLGKLAASE